MSRVRERLISADNLGWAWQKARRLYGTADVPVDMAEVAAFELDLERQLGLIAAKFNDLSYSLRPIALIPQPQKPDSDGRQCLRQSFHLSVRDQVSWIALVNVVGPILDSQMPAWSYGHRLYKAAWYEERDDSHLHLELGPYRHSSGNLYRKFKHSWPLFRRHISLTARLMVNALEEEEQLDEPERTALNYDDKPTYLNRNHWKKVDDSTLYYASIDLERFYPKITKSAILRGLHSHLPDFAEDPWLQNLIGRMLNFRISRVGSKLLGDPMVQPETDSGPFNGIPTGLMVAGFLSNVAMLPLDRLTDQKLEESHRIAQFRFVDDHAFLAYDFDELLSWIREYEKTLAQLEIGPTISQTKFDPPELGGALRADVNDAVLTKIKSESQLDGGHPSKLMTKTLTLVSELAGVDFDILSEESRGQRLDQLEWLLLADLPDREIRADTRAAFAASRIASLVPVAFSPSFDLLQAWRESARLANIVTDRSTAVQKNELEIAKNVAAEWQRMELDRYRRQLARYFKMIFQAFCDHPDKPRLFICALNYCRITGHGGTNQILQWISNHSAGDLAPRAAYLRSLALQIIARHIATAGSDLNNSRLLERQRLAASKYLESIGRPETMSFLRGMLRDDGTEDVASVSTRCCFFAALAWVVDAVDLHGGRRPFHAGLRTLADEVQAPALTAESNIWVQRTGSPIGVWAHWLDGLSHHHGGDPSPVWLTTAPTHDPRIHLDWLSLRKGPQDLPDSQADFLAKSGTKELSRDDAGWLLDQHNSRNPIDLEAPRPGPLVVQRLRRHLQYAAQKGDRISALEWVAYLRNLVAKDDHDPRASEWTALEILRQTLARVQVFRGPEIDVLDDLHPSNILLPKSWQAQAPEGDSFHPRWTWESWKHTIRSGSQTVAFTPFPIKDFRRQPPQNIADGDPQVLWRTRLRGCGLLLLGLLCRDFRLPSSWNVRGLERDTGSFVRAALEELPLSSHSHAIIEASLLPRNSETALIRTTPWAFFGANSMETINDTTADPPLIHDVSDLTRAVTAAQETLQERQISVLDHAPRQLIPTNVIQLISVAVDVIHPDIEL